MLWKCRALPSLRCFLRPCKLTFLLRMISSAAYFVSSIQITIQVSSQVKCTLPRTDLCVNETETKLTPNKLRKSARYLELAEFGGTKVPKVRFQHIFPSILAFRGPSVKFVSYAPRNLSTGWTHYQRYRIKIPALKIL